MNPQHEMFGQLVDLRILGICVAVVSAVLVLTVRRLVRHFVYFLLVSLLAGGAAGVVASNHLTWPAAAASRSSGSACAGSTAVSTYKSGGAKLRICSQGSQYVLSTSSVEQMVGSTTLSPFTLPEIPVTRSGDGWEARLKLADGIMTISIDQDQLTIERTGAGAFRLTKPLAHGTN